jgi:hypothetical protein
MAGYMIISWVLYAYVGFNICNRAYSAYRNNWKAWPILAVLAGLYLIIGALRRLFDFQPMFFYVASVACLLASGAIYRSSRRSTL